MSNITKNLLLALSLICVIALIVFCIQLIVLNRGVEPVTPGTVISGDRQDGSSTPQPGNNGQEPPGGPDGNNGNGNNGGDNGNVPVIPDTPRPPPQGRRYSLGITDTSRLILYVSDEQFDFIESDLETWFVYNGGGIATLEILFEMVSTAQGVGTHAITFLNRYSGSTESEFTGEEAIRGSLVTGYHVFVKEGVETYEAWLHMLDDNDLALVFVINY